MVSIAKNNDYSMQLSVPGAPVAYRGSFFSVDDPKFQNFIQNPVQLLAAELGRVLIDVGPFKLGHQVDAHNNIDNIRSLNILP